MKPDTKELLARLEVGDQSLDEQMTIIREMSGGGTRTHILLACFWHERPGHSLWTQYAKEEIAKMLDGQAENLTTYDLVAVVTHFRDLKHRLPRGQKRLRAELTVRLSSLELVRLIDAGDLILDNIDCAIERHLAVTLSLPDLEAFVERHGGCGFASHYLGRRATDAQLLEMGQRVGRGSAAWGVVREEMAERFAALHGVKLADW
jgi:hypothetical protein